MCGSSCTEAGAGPRGLLDSVDEGITGTETRWLDTDEVSVMNVVGVST